ncbi:MAG TPA: hypothetical protein VHV82_03600 [Sporichthyaceae bacterium]|jgi:hypothetical protein|nr:hypothetical protein [Sporichthyaceae bacterium]
MAGHPRALPMTRFLAYRTGRKATGHLWRSEPQDREPDVEQIESR